jgi:aryl-alcohol dehydrogenase (NADP+)
VRSRFFVASAILGATSIGQLEEQVRLWPAVLPPQALAEVEALNAVYASPAAQ